jgi:hypothetical protein
MNRQQILDRSRIYYEENKEIHAEKMRNWRNSNKERHAEMSRAWYERNREHALEVSRVWREQNRERMNLYSLKWKEDNRKHVLETARIYRETNKDVVRERTRRWSRNNPERVLMNVHLRLARKKALPYTLTAEEYSKTLEHFGNSCALTGRNGGLEREHAIPLSIGHGGTTFENCYPLARELNRSKSNANIFEWFEANRQRFELSQERFDNLIAYLASANAMTVEEYRDHVYWCHANPRSINELEAN